MFKTILISSIILLLFFTGSAFIQTFKLPESIQRGKEVYTTYCQNCHMIDGKGVPGAFPPLEKTDYVKKPAKLLISLVLVGQTGPITVNGIAFNGQMPAQNYLNDEQIADALNYVRNSFGNKTTVAITPDQVKKERP